MLHDDTREVSLATWARKANEAHSQVLDSMRGALTHARAAGGYLCKAKKNCRHGDWTAWLQENFHASEETARVYMRIWNHWSKIQYLATESKQLTLAEALELIRVPKQSKPKGPPNLSKRAQLKITMGVTVEHWSDEVINFLMKDERILDELLWELSDELQQQISEEIRGFPSLLICSTD